MKHSQKQDEGDVRGPVEERVDADDPDDQETCIQKTDIIHKSNIQEQEQVKYHHEEPDSFAEIIYSTVVETLSLVDLATDVIVMRELYEAGHAWWSMWMQLMLVAPYLVSHGSLVVALKKLMSHSERDQSSEPSTCSSISFLKQFSILLSITPISLIYLFVMDIVFAVFSIFATVAFAVVYVCCCCNFRKARYFNMRDVIDKRLFMRFLKMNRTEIIC